MVSGGGETTTTHDRTLERNLGLIPLHQALAGFLVWLPVFVLYTRGRFGLDGALTLASLNYLSVVVAEVPSGWMSDRLGRAVTLRLAAVSWLVGHTCFLVGGDRFELFVVGQFFLATGFACISGTDVSLHYDTLEALGRAGQYTRRQARIGGLGLASGAAAAVIGGLVGLIDLRLAFALSLVAATAQLVVAGRLVEPPVVERAPGLARQLVACSRYLRHRYLAWVFGYGVAMVTLEHLAFTLMQPWLTEVLGRSADDLGATPMFAGVVFAVVSAVGALSARASAPVADRFGTPLTLVGLGVLSALIVTGMAAWAHPLVLVLVAFRSAQGAAGPVLISAEVAARVARSQRATFLSLNSLVGRLGYGLVLATVAAGSADQVRPVLGRLSMVAWVLVVLVAATAWWLTRSTQAEPVHHG